MSELEVCACKSFDDLSKVLHKVNNATLYWMAAEIGLMGFRKNKKDVIKYILLFLRTRLVQADMEILEEKKQTAAVGAQSDVSEMTEVESGAMVEMTEVESGAMVDESVDLQEDTASKDHSEGPRPMHTENRMLPPTSLRLRALPKPDPPMRTPLRAQFT
eukprot:11753204-Karenia_brevis.AAC.1